MKVHKLLEDYLHGQIRKSAGDWDDITNVPDIADSFTEEKKNPFENDFGQDKFSTPQNFTDFNNSNNKLNIVI